MKISLYNLTHIRDKMTKVESKDAVKIYGKGGGKQVAVDHVGFTIPLQAMMDSNGDAIDWPCRIKPLTYLLAAAFVMVVSILVGFMFSRRIKKIDMVGVLKGME